jgi:SNF2 family DNA or RNA helicase
VDAYGLAKLVNPSGVPMFFGQFRDKVMNKVSMYRWIPKPDASQTVHTILQPAIRFEKKQCLDLPPVTFTEREAPMTPQQKSFYKRLKDEMLIEAAGEEVSAVNAAVKINKLLQIACGSVYTDNHEVVDFDVSNRLNVVQEVVDESSNKVLIFVPFTHSIEVLAKHLTKNGITCDVINGAVSVNRRSDIVQRFQSQPDPKVLVIQPMAASHGLTLTAADTIIWYAPCTSVETYLQANARIDRPGQVNPMTIMHITGSQVETRMYSLLRGNIANHQQVIDLYRQEISSQET